MYIAMVRHDAAVVPVEPQILFHKLFTDRPDRFMLSYAIHFTAFI